MTSTVSPESIAAMIADREAGMTQRAIAVRHGFSQQGVGKLLRRHGCEITTRLSDLQKTQIVERYRVLQSSRKVANEFACDHATVCYVVQEAGLPVAQKRTWFFKESLFEQPNNLMAYWLGYVMADGSLAKAGKNTWSLALSLQKVDQQHLLEYARSIGLSPAAVRQHKRLANVTICDPRLGKWLRPWGIVQRKTYEFSRPQVRIELLPHFLRGWFDGDGCLHLHQKDQLFTASVTGHERSALDRYSQSLRRLRFNGKCAFYRQETSIGSAWNLKILRQADVFDFARVLQTRTSFKLNRKWLPLFAYEDRRREQATCDEIRDATIAQDYKNGQTIRAIHQRRGVGEKRIRRALKLHGVPLRPTGPRPTPRGASTRQLSLPLTDD